MDPMSITAAVTFAIGNIASTVGSHQEAASNAATLRAEADRAEIEQGKSTAEFEGDITRRYGAGFLTILKSGEVTTAQLIDTLGKETTYGKTLAEYTRLADQMIANGIGDTFQTGIQAQAQGQSNLTEMQAMDVGQAQAQGAAQAGQATSGIRTASGTGDNSKLIQMLSNALQKENALKQIESQNIQISGTMQSIYRSASQGAEGYRKSKEIDASKYLDSALSAFATEEYEKGKTARSVAAMRTDAEAWDAEAHWDPWDYWLAPLGINI